MADLKKLEFFLLRYVPDAVKDEFVNVGLVMLEPGGDGEGFADVRFTRDWRRVRCLDPQVDVEMLEALERDIRGQLRQARDREALLRKLDDSFSNLIQVSPTKGCLAEEPAKEMEIIARLYFEGPKGEARLERSERQRILKGMRERLRTGRSLDIADEGNPGSSLHQTWRSRSGLISDTGWERRSSFSMLFP